MSDNYKTFEEIIGLELQRSRHKPNKFFGYFHQDIFQYLKGCEVPKNG
ncbi:Eco47II family restriction endonuclease [Helicobacter sp.]|nr:Eco47II family restriction endonuclease [Helicobacter sp.]MCI7711203.1 Eco47II family restriction endonuclease [Helicobacter sp.]